IRKLEKQNYYFIKKNDNIFTLFI
ncbi:uncharacterized protein METZ01_LOCUS510866, partial [marine metagenome]